MGTGVIVEHEECVTGVPHKGARYFSFDKVKYQELTERGFNFEI